MEMPIGLMVEVSHEERVEALLATIACAITGQKPHRIAPWLVT